MDLLKQLYAIPSKSGKEAEVCSFVLGYVRSLDLLIEVDSIGNLFITKGVADIYPCVTAHLDEVHRLECRTIVEDGEILYAIDNRGKRVGLGADDKNGVWIALKLLQELPLLKVALFVEEECDGDLAGCRGSTACSMDWFGNVGFILAVDRKGASDVVTVGKGVVLCDDDFLPKSLLEKYGYSCVEGGRTDIVALKERGLAQPCCNISCGYYNAHKDDEYTNISHLANAYAFVREWLEIAIAKR